MPTSHQGLTRWLQNRPAWDERLDVSDVFHNDDLTLEAKRDAIVDRIKRTRWYRRSDEYDTLREIVEELSEVEDVEGFDCVWDALYDEADTGMWRVWVNTF
jgi:hypothetical protein